MAILGGVPVSTTPTGTFGFGGAGSSRDFIQTGILTITNEGTLESFDINIASIDIAKPIKLKVWRINGLNYDFIGQSQQFTGLTPGENTGLTLNTPINVQVGDLISIWSENPTTIGVISPVGTNNNFKNDDYTTSQPIIDYTVISDRAIIVQVFGTIAGDSITITSIDDNQCIQRDSNNQAQFLIAGNVDGDTVVEYSLDGGAKQILDASATTTFSGLVTITGQQDITVSLSNNPSVTDTKTKLTAAMCVPAWWQSNERGRLINLQSYTVGAGKPTPMMYKDGIFQVMQDPTSDLTTGSLWPLIAQFYSDNDIAICVANVAMGSTKITDWQKGGIYYPRITDFAAASGGIEFTVSLGGESDSFQETPQATIETLLNQTINDLNSDFGTKHYLTYFPWSFDGGFSPIITRKAFDNVLRDNEHCLFGGDLSVIDISIAANATNDGVHIMQDADGLTAANIRYNAFNETSTVNLVSTGIPDGNYRTQIINEVTKDIVFDHDLTWSGGTASTVVSLAVGTKVIGLVIDSLVTHIDGDCLTAVTV